MMHEIYTAGFHHCRCKRLSSAGDEDRDNLTANAEHESFEDINQYLADLSPDDRRFSRSHNLSRLVWPNINALLKDTQLRYLIS
jgi:hypothetical protein